MTEFKEFPKIARFSRDVIVTEKIDGTNQAETMTVNQTTKGDNT